MDEPGKVKLSTTQPAVGFPITATLTDPDTGETGMKWQWQSSPDGSDGSFLDIQAPRRTRTRRRLSVEDDPAHENSLTRRTRATRAGSYFAIRDLQGRRRRLKMPTTAKRRLVHPTTRSVLSPTLTQARVRRPASRGNVAENSKRTGPWADRSRLPTPTTTMLTYTITGGADMDAFKIDPGVPARSRSSKGTKLDFEGSQTTYMVEVTAPTRSMDSGLDDGDHHGHGRERRRRV